MKWLVIMKVAWCISEISKFDCGISDNCIKTFDSKEQVISYLNNKNPKDHCDTDSARIYEVQNLKEHKLKTVPSRLDVQ